MNLGLDKKRVFITASSDGIGLATAKAFLDEGAFVAINGRDHEKLNRACDNLIGQYGRGRVLSVAGDATQTEDIKSFYSIVESEWNGLDVLVCNAGSGKGLSEDQYGVAEWKRLYDINLFSGIKLIDQFRCMLVNGSNPSIVMMSSLASYDRIGAPPAYAAAKVGINSLVKYLADDLSEKGVRVNAVAPGNVFYEGGRWDELSHQNRESVESYIRESVPMKRFGTPEEIADAVAFLASERASFITGTILKVDGGQSRQI